MPDNPHFILPAGDGVFKFIQLYVDNQPYIVCEKDFPIVRHHEILERTLKRLGVQPTFKREFAETFASETGKRYQLVGAGKMHRRGNGDCIFYEESAVYGLGPNKEHLNQMVMKDDIPEGIKPRVDPNY